MTSKKTTYVLELTARDQAKRVLKELGEEGWKSARRLGHEYRRVKEEIHEVGKESERSSKKVRDGWKKAGNFLKASVLPVVLATVAAFAGFSALRTFAQDSRDFARSIAEIRTILPPTTAEAVNLREEILRIAKAQGENEKVVARGLYQTISAGVTEAADALEVLDVAGRLAIAGVSDTATTVDLLTTVINAFSLSASEAEHAADVLFTTVRTGKTTIEQLASGIAVALPAANALGVDIETVTAAISTLTKQGFTTSEAATRVQSLFKQLAKEAKALDKALVPLGVRFDDQTLRSRELGDVLDELRSVTGDSLTRAMELLGGRMEATQAFFALTGRQSKVLASDLRAARDAAGALDRAFGEFANQDFFVVEQTFNAARMAFLDLGDAINTTIARAIQDLGGIDAIEATFKNLASTMQPIVTELIRTVAKLAEGFVVTSHDIEAATLSAERFGIRVEQAFRAVRDFLPDSDDSDRLRSFAAGPKGYFGTNPQLQDIRDEIRTAIGLRNTPFGAANADLIDEIEKAIGAGPRGFGGTLASGEAERIEAAYEFVVRLKSEARELLGLRKQEVELDEERARAQSARLIDIEKEIALARRGALEGRAAAERARLSRPLGPGQTGTSAGDGFAFVGGILTPTVDSAKALLAIEEEVLRVNEAIRLAKEERLIVERGLVLDAEQQAGFQKLTLTLLAQTARSDQEKLQVVRLQADALEAAVMAEAEKLGLGTLQTEELQSQLDLMRKLKVEAITDQAGVAYEQQVDNLLRQIPLQEAQVALVERGAAARFREIEAMREAGRLTDEEAKKLGKLSGVVREYQLEQIKANDVTDAATQAMNAFGQGALRGVEDALVDVLIGSKSTKAAFKDLVRSLIADLVRLAVRLVITNVLLTIYNALTQQYDTIPAAISAVSSIASATASGRAATQSVVTAEKGGAFDKPTLVMLGENGREFVVNTKAAGGLPRSGAAEVAAHIAGMSAAQSRQSPGRRPRGGSVHIEQNTYQPVVVLQTLDDSAGATFVDRNAERIGRAVAQQMEYERSLTTGIRTAAMGGDPGL